MEILRRHSLAVGYPASADGYQVNFRLASDTVKGSSNIQVTAAWIYDASQYLSPIGNKG